MTWPRRTLYGVACLHPYIRCLSKSILSQNEGKLRPSFLSEILEGFDGTEGPDVLAALKGAAGSMYGGASDTV
jgi:hypothetical protein